LNAGDYQVCLEMLEDLDRLGFDIRDFGNNSIVIHGLPAEMEAVSAKNKIEMMIEQYKALQGKISSGIPERVARAAARASAIDYGKQLSDVEMQEIIDQLFGCSNPNYSPSGKLIVRIVELEELEKYFKE
jgi:DNA mismatch repair protein MutL